MERFWSRILFVAVISIQFCYGQRVAAVNPVVEVVSAEITTRQFECQSSPCVDTMTLDVATATTNLIRAQFSDWTFTTPFAEDEQVTGIFFEVKRSSDVSNCMIRKVFTC